MNQGFKSNNISRNTLQTQAFTNHITDIGYYVFTDQCTISKLKCICMRTTEWTLSETMGCGKMAFSGVDTVKITVYFLPT